VILEGIDYKTQHSLYRTVTAVWVMGAWKSKGKDRTQNRARSNARKMVTQDMIDAG
jgi:hypothetical protein